MFEKTEIINLSLKIIKLINFYDIKCTVLTKGILPVELLEMNKINEYGITLISLNEDFRKEWEPSSAPYYERIKSLKLLSENGFKTWVSIEPYPTPNIIDQDFNKILDSISFADKIIFGRLNYNVLVSKYKKHVEYYNFLVDEVLNFCIANNKEYHIKEGTINKVLTMV
jgi:DNA repair photolyase